MVRARLVAYVFACAAFFFPIHSARCQAVVQPAVEAFGALPAMSDPSLSPDGKYLALVQAYKGRPVATIWTLDQTGAAPVIIPYTDGFIDNVRWAKNNRLLIRINMNARVMGDDVNPWHRTVAVDPDGKNPAMMFSNMQEARDNNYSASRIADVAPDDPENIYMMLYAGGGYLLGVYDPPQLVMFRVSVNTGRAFSFGSGGGAHTIAWFTDGNGKVVAREDQTKDPLVDHILAYTEDKGWREIASADATGGQGFDVQGLSLDGKSLVIDAHSDDPGTSGLVQLSLADGKLSSLYFNPTYDVDDALADPWTGRVVGAAIITHMEKDLYFDPALQQMQDQLSDHFPGSSVHALSWDRAVDKVIVSVDGPTSPPEFYLFDRKNNALKRLGRTYAGLQSSDLGQINVYDYKARDGLDIPAYLTLPPGKTPKNLPVVILPHGGPMARDDMEFDWESQFLANRGYAVLRPNFRGSSGYGRKFEEAGYGQWGLKMQDDITDGVKKMIADGIADPKRICIVGGSYGGYAALAGAAFTPDLYACAAAWAPVTDLRQFLATRASDFGRDSWMISTWTRYVGDRWDDAKKLDAASPAQNAAKIRVPVLLMHGEADATVRIDQSEMMESALRRAGKKVTFIRIPKETHHMQAADSRVLWLTELEKFLKENIGN